MQRLTEDQRASVEKLATEAGTTCEGCGSAQLRCGEEARRTHDHGLMVYLWCPNDGEPTNTSRSHLGRSSAPRGESYSPKCLEGEFSEVRIAPVQHL
jgi:hypothetical protein